MANKNPFDRIPIDPLQEFYRRERERREMFKSVLGPSAALRELVGPGSTATQIAALRRADALGGIIDTARLYQSRHRGLPDLMTPGWATALHDTALAVSQRNDVMLQQQRSLAHSFDTGILKTLDRMRLHQPTVSAAMAASQWPDQFRVLADQLAPQFDLLRRAADRMRLFDMATLRATAGDLRPSNAQVAAEQLAEAQRLFEAIGEADTPDESAHLFAALIAALAAIFTQFKENTIEELRKIGLFGLIGLLSALLTFFPPEPAPDASPADNQAFIEIRDEIQSLEERLEAIQQAGAAQDEAYVSALPRAELYRNANIRREPKREGGILFRAPAGTPVAVIRNEGRWKLVVYRDPLTEQLSQGWVYESSVRLLASVPR